MLPIHYDVDLVIGSIVISILACYIALSVESTLSKSMQHNTNYKKIIILLSGFFFGIAIWLMHFIGMLACHLPNGYYFDYTLTIVSLLIAFIASSFAVWLTTQQTLTLPKLMLGSVLMGLGISGMHYLGMMGLIIDGYSSHYDLLVVTFSVLIAISGSGLTFWLLFRYKNAVLNKAWYKFLLAIMMALTIVGMHYTGMTAVSFHLNSASNSEIVAQQNQGIIFFLIIFVTSLVLAVSLIIALLEQRLEERNKELISANRELANQSLQDNLTKLPNRLFLTDYAHILFSQQRLTQGKSAFLYIDLDRFKAVNDVFGHHVGDQLLIQFANKIHKQLASHEKLLRIGGDEFLLVIEDSTLEYATYTAERIHQIVQEGFSIVGKEINISISIGIALFPEHGNNLQDLLMNADSAMLNSKKQGRNTYSLYSYSDVQSESKSQTKLINDLYKAVEEQQFILFYQPKFKTSTDEVCGVEALIRWNHPVHGLLGPNMFIRGAEKTGLIIQMGYWVLEEACKQIQIWEKTNQTNFFPLAVNLSAIQFEHKNLFSILENLFSRYQIQSDRLMIEITESTAMHHIDTSLRSFIRLRQMGIKLAIDDFGTGHSSFLYLKQLPVDELKIDRAFIKDLDQNSKDELILESIIKLATNLGLTVTAEGVETEFQKDVLTRLGCHQLQGFLLGMPMPIDDLEQLRNKPN
ncbi:diguanylate cyclase [Acinetobacter sp. Ac_877]|uniref:bifunctional diguanylate cyclase/phosphodiesterase n=1 Tax=Acinetobacter portensis TaxID=1839785 RepID=UPI00128E4C59|nr:EAL domain-containing protein [Acinetobacter portensis]MPW41938.1 diguanylate cyclase [Acinetobacter portensis]